MRPALGRRFRSEAPYALGLLLGGILLVWSGYLDRSAEVVRRNDFAGFWVGARAIVEGYDPYQVAAWPALADRLGGWADTPVYGYPGWVAVGLVPLALLPLGAASALWTFGGIALAAVAMRPLVRAATPDLPAVHTLAGLTLLASQSARTATILGQWTFLLVAALAASVVILKRRPVAAGLLSLTFLAKPHLFLLAYPAVVARALRLGRARPFVAALAAGGVALLLVSLIVLPGWPSAWVTMSASHRLFDPPRTTTVPALLAATLGISGAVATITFLIVLLGIAALFRPTTDAGLGIWLALSVLVAPYQWSYDHLLLLPAIVLVTSGIASRSRRRAILTASSACLLFLVVGTVLAADAGRRATETLAAIVPVATLAVLVAGAWPLRVTITRRSLSA